MKMTTFQAETLEEAEEMVQSQLGHEAILLSKRKISSPKGASKKNKEIWEIVVGYEEEQEAPHRIKEKERRDHHDLHPSDLTSFHAMCLRLWGRLGSHPIGYKS